MSAPILLIDGYNLLHAAGMAQSEYRRGDLLRCRTRLLRLLHEKLSAAERGHATVVFDARDPPPDRPAQVVVSGIRVLFANPGGDADVLIQQWMSRHPTPRRVMLVSSDRALQRAARSSGAKFVGSREFLEELDRRRFGGRAADRRASSLPDEKPAGHLSSAQAAYWLGVFGDVPIVDCDVPPDEVSANPVPAQSGKAQVRGSGRPRRAKGPQAAPDSKPPGRAARDELAYWLEVFGDQAADSTAASAEELRLADLEKWLKEHGGG